MAANHLDAIIALTNGPAWPTNDNPNEGDLNGHFEYFVGSSTAAAVSGYPDVTVPAGYDAGLPLGITFIGGRWAEPKLLGFAYDNVDILRSAAQYLDAHQSKVRPS